MISTTPPPQNGVTLTIDASLEPLEYHPDDEGYVLRVFKHKALDAELFQGLPKPDWKELDDYELLGSHSLTTFNDCPGEMGIECYVHFCFGRMQDRIVRVFPSAQVRSAIDEALALLLLEQTGDEHKLTESWIFIRVRRS